MLKFFKERKNRKFREQLIETLQSQQWEFKKVGIFEELYYFCEYLKVCTRFQKWGKIFYYEPGGTSAIYDFPFEEQKIESKEKASELGYLFIKKVGEGEIWGKNDGKM